MNEMCKFKTWWYSLNKKELILLFLISRNSVQIHYNWFIVCQEIPWNWSIGKINCMYVVCTCFFLCWDFLEEESQTYNLISKWAGRGNNFFLYLFFSSIYSIIMWTKKSFIPRRGSEKKTRDQINDLLSKSSICTFAKFVRPWCMCGRLSNIVTYI